MNLTVLGSGCILPDPQRGGPAYLVSHQNDHLLLDAGTGALRALVRAGLQPDQLSGVCLTHRHPDHTAEFGLLLELGNTFHRRDSFLVAGPILVDDMLRFFLSIGRQQPSRLEYPVDRLVLPGQARRGSLTIEGRTVPHVDQSVGLRITAGQRTLVYAGDCGPGQAVVDLARGAHLLILECTLDPGQHSAAHLSPEDAARIAGEAGCQRLLLTHFRPGADVEQALTICRQAGIDAMAASDGERHKV